MGLCATSASVKSPDLALVNIGELVTCAGDTQDDPLGVIEGGAVVVQGGKVVWVGTTKKLRQASFRKPAKLIDAEGALVYPGLVDPHTHLVFAGTREDELERKVAGESYTQILESGGGISRTIRDTRGASVSRIVDESKNRLSQLLRGGVTTVEVKTGYGQSLKEELKMLKAIRKLADSVDVGIVPTFLGLHARPPEFKQSASFVDYAVREMLPGISSCPLKPRFSDCFCEEGVFSREECARYLGASARLGFDLKIHADEFMSSGGASLAVQMRCVSADHLGHSAGEDFDAMARAGVAAVLLPATSLYSGIRFADARRVIDSGCSVALGTDLSPNSWIESPQYVMSLACTGMKMTPAEALLGFTRNAAKALGREDVGSIRVGASADFVVSSLAGYRFLPYRVGGDYVRMVFRRGRRVTGVAA